MTTRFTVSSREQAREIAAANLVTSRLTCTCCGHRWDTQEALSEHLDYMASVGL